MFTIWHLFIFSLKAMAIYKNLSDQPKNQMNTQERNEPSPNRKTKISDNYYHKSELKDKSRHDID